MIVYISIGNSDDKLAQNEWSAYAHEVASALSGLTWHGAWTSDPVAVWQNACWCIEVPDAEAELLKISLAHIAVKYRQDSIAWAVAETEFLGPTP